MKTRNGFISNSSTTTFLMIFKKTGENDVRVNIILDELHDLAKESSKISYEPSQPDFQVMSQYLFCGLLDGEEGDYKDDCIQHFYRMHVGIRGGVYNDSIFCEKIWSRFNELKDCASLIVLDRFEI